jgi:hypothetical protein
VSNEIEYTLTSDEINELNSSTQTEVLMPDLIFGQTYNFVASPIVVDVEDISGPITSAPAPMPPGTSESVSVGNVVATQNKEILTSSEELYKNEVNIKTSIINSNTDKFSINSYEVFENDKSLGSYMVTGNPDLVEIDKNFTTKVGNYNYKVIVTYSDLT